MAGRDDLATDLDGLRLLASAFADRPLDVAAAIPGDLSWTDGSTVFVDADAPRTQQVQMVAVQASLLAAGSLAPHLVRQLSRRPALAQRYLAIEGRRALACNESVLPPVVRRLIDGDAVTSLDTPEAALQLARSRQAVPAPAPVFGTILARRILTARTRENDVTTTALLSFMVVAPSRRATRGGILSKWKRGNLLTRRGPLDISPESQK